MTKLRHLYFFLSLLSLVGAATLLSPAPALGSGEGGGNWGIEVELGGFVGGEVRYFPEEPLYPGEGDNSYSLTLSPELYIPPFLEGTFSPSFIFRPFYRLDGEDSERSHFDIREAVFIQPYTLKRVGLELRFGVGTVYWGITESRHLVDIINQTDRVESPDGESKLGQPMVEATIIGDHGTLDLFILPYFRQPTYPGIKGRLRTPFIVDTGRATYESSSENRHIDLAARYFITIGSFDVGISNFYGTARSPILTPVSDPLLGTVLSPHYPIINRGGLELQYLTGGLSVKFEGIYETRKGLRDYFAVVTGFEYTFQTPLLGGKDLGVLAEYLYDGGAPESNTPVDNELMVGGRLSFNDIEGTQILGGVITDISTGGSSAFLEGSRRVGDSWKVIVEGYTPFNTEAGEFGHLLRNDTYLELQLEYYL